MHINLLWDASVATDPYKSSFKSAITYAANQVDYLCANNHETVNIAVGFGECGGGTMPYGTGGAGGPVGGIGISYANLIAALTAHASNATDKAELASLPKIAPAGLASGYLAPAQEKALGLLNPRGTEVDGNVGFSGNPYTYNPANRAQPGKFDLIGMAEHELTHALGRIYGDLALMLVNYKSQGVPEPVDIGGYFSIDGGKTDLANFSPNGDSADWNNIADNSHRDAFNYITNADTRNGITTVDRELMGVLGYNTNPPATSETVHVRCHHHHKMCFI